MALLKLFLEHVSNLPKLSIRMFVRLEFAGHYSSNVLGPLLATHLRKRFVINYRNRIENSLHSLVDNIVDEIIMSDTLQKCLAVQLF